jgi:hypothetical protein
MTQDVLTVFPENRNTKIIVQRSFVGTEYSGNIHNEAIRACFKIVLQNLTNALLFVILKHFVSPFSVKKNHYLKLRRTKDPFLIETTIPEDLF